MVGKDTDSLTNTGGLFKRTLWRRSNNTSYVPIDGPSKNSSNSSSNPIPDQTALSITSSMSENGSLTPNATGVDFLTAGFQAQDANHILSNPTMTSPETAAYENASSSSNINEVITIPTAPNKAELCSFKTGKIAVSASRLDDIDERGSHEDLREMLDSNKDNLKLEAMKRIIGMVAKGKDAGELFPPVVKNVVCKNVEVKKLVYVYLERYAEEHQDLALLSVSTFQKALKDPNQLIRASALRVLSSIRVPVISPIMLLAIKEACADMSPFVRKSAANAIPKLYNLDPDTKDELIGAIEKLLADKTTLVAGSATYAFEDLCPDRLDLIHKHYRRLCSLLIDVDEWGQVVVANMLIRYARTQFLDPNDGDWCDEVEEQNKKYDDPKKFFADTSEEESEEEKQSVASSEKPSKNIMDPDHRLLLRNAKPLLQSRNSAVVMTVCQMYYCLAPRSEISVIVKPMIRLLKSHREIQAIMLNTIVTFSKTHKNLFEPYLKSFYIRANDPTHVKLLKLEIITNLASEASIGIILKEFQAYVHSSDPKFVAATIHAIGRCATTIAEVSDQCLHGLMGLMASKNEIVVAESVVVTKKLLQQKPDENLAVIIHMAKMIDKITIPMARASILWMLGENCDKVQKYAPDVLRKFAKSFPNEEDIVKLQVVNLAAKLYMTSPKQVDLLVRYVLNLAKFDENYDIRDRARLIRNLILPANGKNNINKHAKKILFCEKPAPVLASTFQSRNDYRINTLSHYLNQRCAGYMELPDWPAEKPDESVRNVAEPLAEAFNDKTGMAGPKHSKRTSSKGAGGKGFYSDEDESEEEEEKTPRSGRKKSSKTKSKHGKSKDSDEESESDESEEESSEAEEEESGSEEEEEEESSENAEEEESSDGEEEESGSDKNETEDKNVAKRVDLKAKQKELKSERKAVSGKQKKEGPPVAGKKKEESEDDDDEDEDESSFEEESEEESSDADETDVKGSQKVSTASLKTGKQTTSTTPPIIGSNRSTPPPPKASASKQTARKPVSRKDETSSSDERDEEEDSESSSSEEELKPAHKKATSSMKAKQQSQSSKAIKDTGDMKSASSKVSKSKTKKDESKVQKEAEPYVVEEATLLSFDDVPNLPPSGGTTPQLSCNDDRTAAIKARPMLPTLVSQSSEDRGLGMIAQQVPQDGVSKSSSSSSRLSAAAAYTSINSSANGSEDDENFSLKKSSHNSQGASSRSGGAGVLGDKKSSGDNPASSSVDSILFGSPVNKMSSPLSASTGGYGTAPKVDYKNLRSIFDDTESCVGNTAGGRARAIKSQLPPNGRGISGTGKASDVVNGSSMDSSLWG